MGAVKWLRKQIAYAVWNLADWIYPYAEWTYDETTERGWEIVAYIDATEQEANAVFERLSDATCGEAHHALDVCPGPSFVLAMHPSQAED